MDDRYGGRLQNFWTFQNLRSTTQHAAGHGNAGEGCCSARSMFGEWRLEQRGMFEIPITWHILKHSQITVSPNSQMCERGFTTWESEGIPNYSDSWVIIWSMMTVSLLLGSSSMASPTWMRVRDSWPVRFCLLLIQLSPLTPSMTSFTVLT